MSSKFVRRMAIQSCATAALLAVAAPVAYAQEQTYTFDIPAQGVASALLAFGRQSHQQVVFDGATVQGKSSAVKGQYTASDALKTLLSGTKLTSRLGAQGEFIVTEGQEDPAVELGGIVVTGRLNQIAKTIQAKRNADVVSDGVASDEISSIPEFGLGDALARVPGVVFQINNGRGEDQFMTLRGLNADYGSTTVDGIALPTSEETTRQTSFDILPSVLVKSVDVYKTWTVDLPTDAISGVTDLHTRSAFDHPGLFISGHLDGAYWENEREEHPNQPSGQADLTLSKTFGPEDQFGFLVLGSFYTRSSDTLNTYTLPWTYYTPNPGGAMSAVTPAGNGTGAAGTIAVPNTHRWYFYDNVRTRPGVFTKLEWKKDDIFHIALSGGVFEHQNNENRYSNYITKGTGAVVDETTPTTGTVSTGKADVDYDRYFQYRELAYVDLRAELNLSANTHVDFDANYGYGHYRQDTIEDQFLTSSSAAYGYSYNLNAPTSPLFTPTTPSAVSNLANYIEQYHLTSVDASHSTEPQYKVDFKHNVDPEDRGWGFKAGLYHRDLSQTYYYNSITATPLAGDAPSLATVGVLHPISPSNGEGQQIIALDPEAVTAYIKANPGAYGVVASGNINDYHLREIIDAGYGEARFKSDNFTIIGGLRWEQTSQNIENLLGATPTTAAWVDTKSKYAKLLPSVNASYDLTPKLKARAAITETLARPEYSQMAENGAVNESAGQAAGAVVGTVANPNLKPRESWNYDASLEYYPASGIQASVAVFDKEISNEIISETVPAPLPFPQGQGYQLLEAVNAGHARVNGVELSLVDEKFSFLPGPLRYLGASANATLLNMDAPMIRMSNGSFEKLPQLLNSAKSVVNASLFYNYHKFFGEVAYNYTGKMPISFDTTSRINDQWWAAIDTIDAQLRYSITDHFYVRLQGKNLTDAQPQKVVGPNQSLNYSTLDNGRAFWAGVGFVF